MSQQAGAAILQKGHFYEVLTDLQRTASIWAECHPTVGEVSEREGSESEREAGESTERERETLEVERESPMDIDTLLESASLSEGDLERLQGLLEEMLHLLETAPYCMVQPPGKAFPTSARITGPPERDDPYPTLYRSGPYDYKTVVLFIYYDENSILIINKGIVHQKKKILSLITHPHYSKPVRPSFIFGTQIKILLRAF